MAANSAQSIQQELAGILNFVEPWPDHILPFPDFTGTYSNANWDGLVSAAKVIQNDDPRVVEEALHIYQGTHNQHATRDDSKLLLLMRVAFELPESRPREQWIGFGGWRDFSGSENMTTNAAWPISWNQGHPKLLVGFTLFQGRRYDAGAEFTYFLNKYPLRDLTSFLK